MTQAEIEAHLAEWKAADLAVAKGQSYNIGSRSLTRADAETIGKRISYWEQRLEAAQAATAGVRSPRVVYARWN